MSVVVITGMYRISRIGNGIFFYEVCSFCEIERFEREIRVVEGDGVEL